MGLMIQERQRVILLHSEVTKDYPWFLRFLEENERITAELISELPEQERSFVEHVVPEIIKTAFKEWRRDASVKVVDKGPQEDPACRAEWMNCSLDNTPNRFVYWIMNTVNGGRLNVGSTCVQDFMGNPRQTKELEEEATKNFNHSSLNSIFPGVRETVLHWASALEDYPVLIPDAVEGPFLALGRSLKKSFDVAILQKNMDSGIFGEIERALEDRALLLEQIGQYANRCLEQEPKDIVTKEIETWLRGGTDEARKGLEELKGTGRITPFVAHRIREPGYMAALVPELDKILKKMSLSVLGRSQIAYVLVPTSHREMRLLCPHKDLLLECGHTLYGDKNAQPSFAEIICRSELADESSRCFVERELGEMHARLGQRIFGTDTDFDEIVMRKKTGRYTILGRKKFLNKFKLVVLEPSETNLQDLQAHVEACAKEYSLGEIKDMEQLRREHRVW